MRSILRICYKFSPLFLGVISIFLLGLALVPGRLEDATGGTWLLDFSLKVPLFGFIGGLFVGIVGLALSSSFLLAFYEVRKILHGRKNNLNLPQLPGFTSLLILLGTSICLHFHLPSQLSFYLASDRFDRALVQHQILNEGKYKKIEQIGNLNILRTIVSVENNSSANTQSKSIYFVTTHREFKFQSDDFGFAYLLRDRKGNSTYIANTHIYGNWYIFYCRELCDL
jgi:hypothetical protein